MMIDPPHHIIIPAPLLHYQYATLPRPSKKENREKIISRKGEAGSLTPLLCLFNYVIMLLLLYYVLRHNMSIYFSNGGKMAQL